MEKALGIIDAAIADASRALSTKSKPF